MVAFIPSAELPVFRVFTQNRCRIVTGLQGADRNRVTPDAGTYIMEECWGSTGRLSRCIVRINRTALSARR
jgi:hypothetical protein